MIGRNITVRTGNTGTITLGGAQASGVSTFTGTVSLGKDTTLQALGSSEVALTGVLQGDPAAKVFVAGGGTVRLGGANTYPGGTTVKTGGRAKITGSVAWTSGVTVEPGANLELAGASGSLASTIAVTNNGALLVTQPAVAGAIGGSGTTTVDSTLSAASIVQNALSIGPGGAVTIRETTAVAAGGTSAVPEPSVFVLLLSAIAGALLLRKRP
jgi:autotransporter-associated beta strand protein